jgi:hypothetical protein
LKTANYSILIINSLKTIPEKYVKLYLKPKLLVARQLQQIHQGNIFKTIQSIKTPNLNLLGDFALADCYNLKFVDLSKVKQFG